jgi:hypothetical protein
MEQREGKQRTEDERRRRKAEAIGEIFDREKRIVGLGEGSKWPRANRKQG